MTHEDVKAPLRRYVIEHGRTTSAHVEAHEFHFNVTTQALEFTRDGRIVAAFWQAGSVIEMIEPVENA